MGITDNRDFEEKLKQMKAANKKGAKADPTEISITVNEKKKWMLLGHTMGAIKTDDDLWKRMTQFWDLVGESGEVPHKEDFYLFCGISSRRASDWRKGKGCSEIRADMMAQFDMLFDSVIDNLAVKGEIAQIPYIWQSKQFQGYKEPETTVNLGNVSPLAALPQFADVKQKYLDLVQDDDIVDAEYSVKDESKK